MLRTLPAPQDAPPQQAPPQQAPAQQAPAHQPQAHAQPQQHGQPGQAPQQWQSDPGVPTYVSPIPIRKTHLGHALASEWTKIRSVRSTMWTLGVMLVLVLGIGTLVGVVAAASDVSSSGASAIGLGSFGVILGMLCVMTLGVLTIGSEYGTGMIRTTTTACPSRSRILGAKAIVFFVLVFVITTLATTLVAALQTGMVDAAEATGEEWLRGTVGVGLFVATLGLLSLAVGALVRHSAGAITIMIGLVLLPLVLAMFMFSESLKDVQLFLFQYSIPSQLIALYGESVAGGTGPSGWDPVWIMLGLTTVALGAAFLTTETRDV
ncbi:ABC transporter permease subunit [Streptomyces sp. Da 82-17]|uniref:ABC transporter permease subunit n=1 Tax=Streptomyces sp. Da 82-17 TaxID=3377116 RepID=UPI0038D46FCC